MTDIVFPVLSENDPQSEGVVATWFVDDGSRVNAGDLVAEVAVDKVDAEVTAPESGRLAHIVEEGAVTTQGSAIGTVTAS